MSKPFRVIWADDDFEGGLKGDSEAEVLMNELRALGIDQLDVSVCSSPSDSLVDVHDRERRPDVVIFDWYYPKVNVNPAHVLAALLAQAPHIPVILYSGVASPADIQPYPNVRAFVAKGRLEALIATVGGFLKRELPRIIHLSDLHFGLGHGHGQRWSYESLLDSLQSEVSGHLADCRSNMVVVSGDLTSRGSRDEFAQARHFLVKLAELLHVGGDQVYVVPGNHDVQLSDPYSYNSYYQEFVLPFYRQYPAVVAAYLGAGKEPESQIEQDDVAWVRSAGHVSCTAIGLNSVSLSIAENHRVGQFERGTIGNVRTAQLTKLAQRLKAFGELDGVRVAILHHQLFPVPSRRPGDAEDVLSADENRVVVGQASLLNWLDEHGVQVVLHGHSHYAAGRTVVTHYTGRWQQRGHPIHVFSCGTTGASALAPGLTEHCYGVFEITEDGGSLALSGRSRVLPQDGNSWRAEPGMSVAVPLESTVSP